MDQKSDKHISMTVREILEHKDRFRLAPGVPASQTKELPMREKQAVVDEVFRGMPIANFECYEQTGPDGVTRYIVTRGWPQLCAIIDFTNDKFPTWSPEEKREWEQGREDRG